MQIILTEEEYNTLKNKPADEAKAKAKEILDTMIKQVERNIQSFPDFMKREMVNPVKDIMVEAVRTARTNLDKL